MELTTAQLIGAVQTVLDPVALGVGLVQAPPVGTFVGG